MSRLAARYGTSTAQPVVNATGVLLHTNLGRAPVACHPIGATTRISNTTWWPGNRGDRSDHAAALLAKACGAEAAFVVNNGAAALLLVLTVLAVGREVVVSRGELVEIGGGFRIPEVMTASGARLVEVGTTNRTRCADYAGAISADTALTLKVHTSNYRITGFTEVCLRRRTGAPRAPGRRGSRVGSVGRAMSVAQRWSPAVAGGGAGSPPGPRSGCGARDLLR